MKNTIVIFFRFVYFESHISTYLLFIIMYSDIYNIVINVIDLVATDYTSYFMIVTITVGLHIITVTIK